MYSLAQALTPPFSKKRSCGARSRIRGVKSVIYSNKRYSVFGNMCKKTGLKIDGSLRSHHRPKGCAFDGWWDLADPLILLCVFAHAAALKKS